MADSKRILLCRCAYSQVADRQTVRDIQAGLRGGGAVFETVADLCALSAGKDPLLKELASAGKLAVVACYGRAVKWLFAAAGSPLDEGRVEFYNMRVSPAGEILRSLLGAESAEQTAGPGPAEDGPQSPPDGWLPWFPVIDYDRCKNCKQCLNFCLFGVYEPGGDGKVEVRNPANCKTNCPACARVCPEAAIMFPKYSASPINGDVVSDGQAVKVDLAQLAGGDVRSALRRRRFAVETDRPGKRDTN